MAETDIADALDPGILTESDYALFDAMQENVRAPWSEVATRTGLSPATAKRRWNRLVSSGIVWTTCYPGRKSATIMAVIEVACEPGRSHAVRDVLVAEHRVMNLGEVTGDFEFVATVLTVDTSDLRNLVNETIGSIPGVHRSRVSLHSQLYRDGSAWNFGALPKRNPTRSSTTTNPPPPITDPRVLQVMAVLERDARATTSDIASVLDCSDAHARRFVRELQNRDIFGLRLDISTTSSGKPYAHIMQLITRPEDLQDTVAKVASLPTTRMCATSIGGPSNLYIISWMRSLEDSIHIESTISRQSKIQVVDRKVVLKYHKTMGWIIDENNRRAGLVSWAAGTLAEHSTGGGANRTGECDT